MNYWRQKQTGFSDSCINHLDLLYTCIAGHKGDRVWSPETLPEMDFKRMQSLADECLSEPYEDLWLKLSALCQKKQMKFNHTFELNLSQSAKRGSLRQVECCLRFDSLSLSLRLSLHESSISSETFSFLLCRVIAIAFVVGFSSDFVSYWSKIEQKLDRLTSEFERVKTAQLRASLENYCDLVDVDLAHNLHSSTVGSDSELLIMQMTLGQWTCPVVGSGPDVDDAKNQLAKAFCSHYYSLEASRLTKKWRRWQQVACMCSQKGYMHDMLPVVCKELQCHLDRKVVTNPTNGAKFAQLYLDGVLINQARVTPDQGHIVRLFENFRDTYADMPSLLRTQARSLNQKEAVFAMLATLSVDDSAGDNWILLQKVLTSNQMEMCRQDRYSRVGTVFSSLVLGFHEFDTEMQGHVDDNLMAQAIIRQLRQRTKISSPDFGGLKFKVQSETLGSVVENGHAVEPPWRSLLLSDEKTVWCALARQCGGTQNWARMCVVARQMDLTIDKKYGQKGCQISCTFSLAEVRCGVIGFGSSKEQALADLSDEFFAAYTTPNSSACCSDLEDSSVADNSSQQQLTDQSSDSANHTATPPIPIIDQSKSTIVNDQSTSTERHLHVNATSQSPIISQPIVASVTSSTVTEEPINEKQSPLKDVEVADNVEHREQRAPLQPRSSHSEEPISPTTRESALRTDVSPLQFLQPSTTTPYCGAYFVFY